MAFIKKKDMNRNDGVYRGEPEEPLVTWKDIRRVIRKTVVLCLCLISLVGIIWWNGRDTVNASYIQSKINKSIKLVNTDEGNGNNVQLVINGGGIGFPMTVKEMGKAVQLESVNDTLKKETNKLNPHSESGFKEQELAKDIDFKYKAINLGDNIESIGNCLVSNVKIKCKNTVEARNIDKLDYDKVRLNINNGSIRIGESVEDILKELGKQGYSFYCASRQSVNLINVYTDQQFMNMPNTLMITDGHVKRWHIEIQMYDRADENNAFGECKCLPDLMKGTNGIEIRHKAVKLVGNSVNGLYDIEIEYETINKNTIAYDKIKKMHKW